MSNTCKCKWLCGTVIWIITLTTETGYHNLRDNTKELTLIIILCRYHQVSTKYPANKIYGIDHGVREEW